MQINEWKQHHAFMQVAIAHIHFIVICGAYYAHISVYCQIQGLYLLHFWCFSVQFCRHGLWAIRWILNKQQRIKFQIQVFCKIYSFEILQNVLFTANRSYETNMLRVYYTNYRTYCISIAYTIIYGDKLCDPNVGNKKILYDFVSIPMR